MEKQKVQKEENNNNKKKTDRKRKKSKEREKLHKRLPGTCFFLNSDPTFWLQEPAEKQ